MKNWTEKLQKKLHEAEGFPLIELIVVIAIPGILTAIAASTYIAYIDRAHEAADLTELDSVQTAAFAALAETGNVDSMAVTSSTVTAKVGTTTHILYGSSVTDEEITEDFLFYYYGEEPNDSTTISIEFTGDEYTGGATRDGDDWTACSSGSRESRKAAL